MLDSDRGLAPARSHQVLRAIASAAIAIAITSSAGVARAEDHCPLGSSEKTESGFTWCEPSICETDTQCQTGSVCRPVALCVEVGTVDAGTKGAGGPRLLARQRCGAAKACPQSTTCSEKSRCITRAQADQADKPTSVPSSAASAAPSGASDAPKKACGCDLTATARSGYASGALVLVVAMVLIGRRRAHRT